MKGLSRYFFVVLLFLGTDIFAQDIDSTKEEKNAIKYKQEEDTTVHSLNWSEIKPKLVFGGSLGLSFNDGYTFFEVSPQVGYKVKENTVVGAGLQMFGITNKYDSYFQYGPDFFIRQHLLNILFAQAQFEYINFETYALPGKRYWNPAFLLGFGYGTYGYSFGLFTDVLHTKYSEYIYPGHIYFGPKTGKGRYPYGVPLFFKVQLFF